MATFEKVFLIALLIAAIISCGCINQRQPYSPTSTTSPTAIATTVSQPTPVIHTPTPAPKPTAIATTVQPTPAPTPTRKDQPYVLGWPVPELTPEPVPVDYADASTINFTTYADSDFTVRYTSEWKINKSNVSPFPVGPFRVTDDDPNLRPEIRAVTFSAPDNTTEFAAMTQDFVAPGSWTVNQNIRWIKDLFLRDYPDLSPMDYMGNYKYFTSGTAMGVSYEVVLPEGTKYYPSAYAVQTVVTDKNIHTYGFFTARERFGAWSNLKDIVMGSIKSAY